MSDSRYAVRIRLGTHSVRALLVDIASGRKMAVYDDTYHRGEQGIFRVPEDVNLARQDSMDYHNSVIDAVSELVSLCSGWSNWDFRVDNVIRVEVTAPGGTLVPADRRGHALSATPAYRNSPNLNAYTWLCNDHTATVEAEAITTLATRIRPEYLRHCGGTYSPEWFWAKIWHCLNVAPDIFAAAYTWVEVSDYVPAYLTEAKVGREMFAHATKRNRDAAKMALFSPEWGGLPDEEFLALLHPDLVPLRSRLYDEVFDSDTCAGGLSAHWAEMLYLNPGTPVSVGTLCAPDHDHSVEPNVMLRTQRFEVGSLVPPH